MRQFNAAPGWPDPPSKRWKPPKRWRPSESWPPAPAGWAFWVNEAGEPVRGPIGRYGGPSRVKVGAIVAVPLALIAAVLFNPFDDGEGTGGTLQVRASEPTAVPTSATTTETTAAPSTATTPRSTASPGTIPTPAVGSATPSATSPTPTTGPTRARTQEPTEEPTQEPTQGPTRQPTEPSPTDSRTTPTPTVVPITTTAAVFQTCAEARAAGKAPLHRGDPGYSEALDRNGDGVACDRGNS